MMTAMMPFGMSVLAPTQVFASTRVSSVVVASMRRKALMNRG